LHLALFSDLWGEALAERYKFVFEPLAIASLIAVIDVIVGLVVFLIAPAVSLFIIAGNLLIVEFGVMLITGGCMMSRQPLEDEKRFDEQNQPVLAWRMALLGKKILTSSVFVLVLSLLFSFIGIYF
jgi:hypothetical protein